MSKRRVLFLDRDGTINIDKHYVYRTEDFEWVPGIAELCRSARGAGYDIVVVTNQSGIERGYFTEEDYERFTQFMREQFEAEGVQLLDVLHCPWLKHADRKPEPGLFLRAAERWNIDMEASLSLGDKPRDVQAGINAGVGRNYLLSADAECAEATATVADPRDLISFLTD